MKPHDLEPTLRRLRLADPSPELRRSILDACAAPPRRIGWAVVWAGWRPELALAASVALLLAAVVAATAPPVSPVSPPSRITAAPPSPVRLADDGEARSLLAAAGPGMRVPWPALPDWPPEVRRLEQRLAREVEPPPANHPPPRGEPPC